MAAKPGYKDFPKSDARRYFVALLTAASTANNEEMTVILKTIFAGLLVASLAACSASSRTQSVSKNDLIQRGIESLNTNRAGAPGSPVDLISVSSADNGAFSAELLDERLCVYSVHGKLEGEKIVVTKDVTQACPGRQVVRLTAEIHPRNKGLDQRACQGDERQKLMCFVETDRANRALVLATAE